MTTIACPACTHRFESAPAADDTPDASVLRWFTSDQSPNRDTSTAEAYAIYLRSAEGTPVSRRRFVSDLAYLGLNEVLDDDTYMLIRD